MATIYTVGHGTRSAAGLGALLAGAGVTRLVDVRRFPGSRHQPTVAREHLARALPERGIAYDFYGEVLGGRRRARPHSRHRAWRNESLRAYADHMDSAAFRTVLQRLEHDAGAEVLALMCAETLWWRCHRRLIADALVLRGHEVIHLLDAHSRQAHDLHPGLRDEGGWPVYDGGQASLLP